MRRAALFLFLTVFLLIMAGCGRQSPSQDPPVTLPLGVADQVSLTITDTPPAGVAVLFFQLNITGASLASQSGVSTSLLSSPIPVNVTQLQTQSAFLATASVPIGDYSSSNNPTATFTGLTLTFSSPQLTIYNGSGATIGSGANACANNTVCQITPSATPLTLTFSSSPFPVTVSSSSLAPLAFVLDIHLDTVIQPDLTLNLAATNGVTVSQLPTPPSGRPISALGNLTGTIQTTFTSGTAVPDEAGLALQTGDGRTLGIEVNNSTAYNYPSSVCSTGSSSCLTPGQIVEVRLSLQSDGNLLASEIDYVQPAGQTVVEGNIVRLTTSGGNTLMDLILQEGPPTPAPNVLPSGQRATVTVPPTEVTYAVDSGAFTIPSGLHFASATDLFVGQEVSVVVQGSVTTTGGSGSSSPWAGPAAITFTTNRITLEPSQITGSVTGIDASMLMFGLNTNPNYFVPPSTTAGAPPTLSPFNLTVQVTAGTTFTNFTPDSISGLAVNDVVSIQGWAFLAPSNNNLCQPGVGCAVYPAIAAEAVVGRPGPPPLF